MARIALLFVVFVDILGQGLLFPILSAVLLDPSQDFLPKEMSASAREFRYGIVLGLFYLAWFFGAAFISKLSDYIGRKICILVCLAGALAGYALTVLAFDQSSLLLLVLGRVVGGFTAGNQPIAQAALIDGCRNDTEKSRLMGYIVAAISLGLVAGPLFTAVFSDTSIMGSYASLKWPLYTAILLILVNTVFIVAYFKETLAKRRKIDFGVSEVFLTLWRILKHPVTLRLAPVYFFAVMGFNAYFIFLDDFLYARFRFDTVQNSVVMIVLGGTMGLVSALLVGPVAARFRQIPVFLVTVSIMALSIALMLFNPVPDLSYLLAIPVIASYALCYPTLLSMFSESVDPTEQGWVMGVTIALFTIGSGGVSFVGGTMMKVSPGLPFIIAIASCILALVLVALLWRARGDIAALDPHKAEA